MTHPELIAIGLLALLFVYAAWLALRYAIKIEELRALPSDNGGLEVEMEVEVGITVAFSASSLKRVDIDIKSVRVRNRMGKIDLIAGALRAPEENEDA